MMIPPYDPKKQPICSRCNMNQKELEVYLNELKLKQEEKEYVLNYSI